jgi:hypothetical protein
MAQNVNIQSFPGNARHYEASREGIKGGDWLKRSALISGTVFGLFWQVILKMIGELHSKRLI